MFGATQNATRALFGHLMIGRSLMGAYEQEKRSEGGWEGLIAEFPGHHSAAKPPRLSSPEIVTARRRSACRRSQPAASATNPREHSPQAPFNPRSVAES